MKAVLFVATVVKTHIMEFHIPYLKMLKEMGFTIAVAARNDYDNPLDCKIPYCDKYYDIPFERNPLHPGNIKAYQMLKKIIDDNVFDIVHCHTPVGGMITRLAARKARKKGSKVFYTAHGFHFFKGAPAINWIVYYPVERILAHKTDVLITISKEDYARAQHFRAKKVVYIPGIGIDLKKFAPDESFDSSMMKKELNIPEDAVVLLSVGEVNENKNHKVVIEALPEIPNAWYILCGQGPLIDAHRQLSKELGVSERFITTGYRTDIKKFYQMADIFVFPSIREGLPVALMEAMATGKICVASKNRGTNDLLDGSRLRFEANDVEELKRKIKDAITNDCSDEIERNQVTLHDFDLVTTLSLMKRYYQESTDGKLDLGVLS